MQQGRGVRHRAWPVDIAKRSDDPILELGGLDVDEVLARLRKQRDKARSAHLGRQGIALAQVILADYFRFLAMLDLPEGA